MAKFHLASDNFVIWHCPGCGGGHGVPVNGHPSGKGWTWNGSLESPTLAPSVLINVGGTNPTKPLCHTFIRDGKIQFLGDCTHALAGQTIDIPEWE